MAKYNLIDSFPISKFQPNYDDIIVNNRGEYTIGFKLNLAEVFTLEEFDYFEIDKIFESIIRRLPKYSIVHFQFRYKKIEFKEDSFKNFENERYGIYKAFKFFERAMIKDEVYIFFTKSSQSVKKRNKGLSLLHKTLINPDLINSKVNEDFYNCILGIEDILKNSKYFQVKRLLKKDYNNLELNNGILPDYFSLKTTSVGKSTYDDIEINSNIKIGNKYASINHIDSLRDFPDSVSPIKPSTKLGATLSYCFNLGLSLSFDHIVNHYIFIDDPQLTSTELQNKRNKLSNFASVSAENKANYEGLALFVEAVAKYERLPVRYYLNVINIANSEIELQNQGIEIQSAFSEIGFTSKINHTDKAEIFWAGCPGNASDLPSIYTSTLLLDQAVSLVQKESAYNTSTSLSGITLSDRLTGYPLSVDFIFKPKELGIIPNYNAFTIGPSGSGKSFLTNTILRSLYNQGNHVVILDMGGSYRRTCLELNGIYIDPTDESFPGYNPFLLTAEEITDERIEIIAQVIFTIWYQEDGKPSKETAEILKQHIYEYYNQVFKKNIFCSFNTFYDFVTQKYDYITNLINQGVNNELTAIVTKNFFDYDSFKIVLSKYARGGRLEKLLNSKTVLNLKEDRFVVFEIENIKDNLTMMNLQVIMIMDVFLTKILKLGEKNPTLKTLLIEEAWKSMMNENMSNFLKYSVKTFRKYNGQLNTVTQEIDDLLGNEIVKNSIVNSSPIKILLDPGTYREQIDVVADLLSLTSYQKQLYTSLNKNNDPNSVYKEVLIITGAIAMVYRVEVSDYEYALYTTNKTEVNAIQDSAKKNGGDIILACRDYAEYKQLNRLLKH